ncbi:hypothetical protein BH11MYX1_BH11MYX1_18270 [soil metagenome]
MNDRDLISAYLDGVGELTPAERQRVEALLRDEPAAAAEAARSRALIGQLRALPSEGSEPDWSVLEREIRIAVGPQVPGGWRQPWLRWLIPVGALVAGVAIVLLIAHPHRQGVVEPAPRPSAERSPVAAPPAAQDRAPSEAIWLDGEAVDLGDVDPSFLINDDDKDDKDDDKGDALADDSGVLPTTNLDWIDALDERALDRAEAWLDHEKGHKKG